MPHIGFDLPLPAPGRALRRGHWSTDGLRAMLLPNSGSPSIQVHDPVRDLFTPIASSGHPGTNVPTDTGLIQFVSINGAIDVTDNQSTIINPSQVTILLVRQRADLVLGNTMSFGSLSGTAADRCSVHLPWSDGNIYWMFGGTTDGVNMLTVTGAAAAATTKPEAWALIADPLGQRAYRDGALLGSHSTPAAGPTYTGPFQLNAGAVNGDLQTVSFFAVLDAGWNEEQVKAWSTDQTLMFARPRVWALGWPALMDSGFVITIDGVGVKAQAGSIRINRSLNGRGTMTCDIVSMDGTYRSEGNKPIIFTYNGVRMFAGTTVQPDEEGHRSVSKLPIVTHLQSVDYKELPSRREVAMTIPAGSAREALQQLIEPLEPYGVTMDPEQVDGPDLDEIVLQEGPLDGHFDTVAMLVGQAAESGSRWVWDIDYFLVARMYEPGTVAAPFNIADGDRNVLGDLLVSPSYVDYRNRIFVKYTTPATKAYSYFVMDDIPTDGETAKAGPETYTFKDTPVNPNDVQIGANVPDTLDSLVGAIFPANSEVVAFRDDPGFIVVTAKEAGAAGNSIQVETNCVDSHWGVEGYSPASHLANGTDDALTGLVTAEDVGEQDGGANLRERTYEHPEVVYEATAQAIADGYLEQHLAIPKKVGPYATRQITAYPGMSQHIQAARRNLDDDCLLNEVEIFSVGHRKLRSKITATTGLVITKSTVSDLNREAFGRLSA